MNQGNKILILGASSYIGQHLQSRIGPDRSTATYKSTRLENGVYFDASGMELRDVIESPKEYSHAIILLGINKPDLAAADVKRSDQLNVSKIRTIIDQLVQWEISPVFTSTESVFDGSKGRYVESDPPRPILTYGRQKVEIEKYLQGHCETYLILRLARVLGSQPGDGTLFDQWITAIKNRETIYCAHDQISSPIYIDDVVAATTGLIDQKSSGVYHLASTKPLTRLNILEAFVTELKNRLPVNPEIVPCSINDVSLSEKRPLDISMQPNKLVDTIGISLTDVQQIGRIFVENLNR